MTNNIITLAKQATQAAQTVSEKYQFASTERIHEMLSDYGFHEDKYKQARQRNPELQGFQRHLSILQRESDCDQNGGFNLLLLNSHDGSSSIRLEAGYFRILCENQLGHGDVGIRVRHTGDVTSKLERAIPQVLFQMEEFKQLVAELRGRRLTTEQAELLTARALALRGLPDLPENRTRMGILRRREDNHDAWGMFNAVQENMVRGGVRFYVANKDTPEQSINLSYYDYRKLRALTSADRLLNANRELTATMRDLLAA